MNLIRTLLFCLVLVHAGAAEAAFYLVGNANDQDCTHSFAQAVAAANANPGRDTIFLGFDQAGVAVDITDDLDIVGGFTSCEASELTGFRTTLIGNGANTALFVDNTADLRLYDVAITNGGSNANAIGGAIWKNGQGAIELHNVELYGNRSLNGGGMYVSAGAMALLYAGTRIHENTAQRGGGIFVDEATLRMDNADVAIYLNNAILGAVNGDRYGGGIYATGTASRQAEISSLPLSWDGPGSPVPPTYGTRIYLNVARDGGGIYANPHTSVTLLETTLYDNTATRYGGGIFLLGASLQMLRRYSVVGSMTPLCTGAFGCSALRHNMADWSGAAVSLWNGASAHIAQTSISGNIARDSTFDSYTQSTLSGLNNRLTIEASVIAGNTCTQAVGTCHTISMTQTNNHSELTLRHVTMADNAALNNGFSAEISTHPSNPGDTNVSILSSIIEPGAGMDVFSANSVSIFSNDCLMAPGPLPATSTRSLQRAAPYRFVARAARDYRLGDAEPGIDGCDSANIAADTMLTLAPDLGYYGSVDDADVPNRLGGASTHDLGAFEMTPLLRNGFE